MTAAQHLLVTVFFALVQSNPAGTPQPQNQAPAQITPGKVALAQGITITHPANWAAAKTHVNAEELVTPPPESGKPVQARTVITTEQRRDHTEAVQRLAEIAETIKAPVTYLNVSGWPAVQRRYKEQLPRVGRAGEIPGPEVMVVHTTTAIASGNTVVRLETTLMPGAPATIADQAEAIGRQMAAPAPQSPAQTQQEILKLRQHALKPMKPISAPAVRQPTVHGIAEKAPPHTKTIAAVQVNGGAGEVEVAASNDGHVVVASNSGLAVSSDFGATFPTFIGRGGFFTFPNNGDPSTSVGASGNFYMSYLGLPNGTTAAAGLNGCAVSVSDSANGGMGWGFAGHAASCPLNTTPAGGTVCFPDQEHIAADRYHQTLTHHDQIYAVWRHFTANGIPCTSVTTGNPTPSLSCSSNGASAWGAPVAVGNGDHPRVAVGGDSSVYTLHMDGNSIVVHKFTSCENGLQAVTGFPVTVQSITPPDCAVAGMDRCSGAQLASPMLAVDDTDSNHLYVAFAQKVAAGNDSIMVVDSSDGGLHWGQPVTANSGGAARRVMPWVCSLGGRAFVSWFDRRSASSSANDLTEYFQQSVGPGPGGLTLGGERNLSGAADPQCASGWPAGVDNTNDSETCSTQPQLAGRCRTATGGSNTACDFNQTTCPAGESCVLLGGAPKYGDYNGNACAGSRAFTAWASATAPAGSSSVSSLTVFSDVNFVPTQVSIFLTLTPSIDPGRFNLLLDGSIAVAAAGPGAHWTSQSAAGIHTITVTPAAGTNLPDYSVRFGGDCAVSGALNLLTATTKTCDVTIEQKGYAACDQNCTAEDNNCMAQVPTPGGPRPQECVQQLKACRAACLRIGLRVVKTLLPSADPGRFNMLVDGVVRVAGVGNGGGATFSVSAGSHTVSESGAGGTNLSNYSTTIGGDCASNGSVNLTYGNSKICTLTNTATTALLTVNEILIPATDPGRFDLQIDSVTRTPGAGNGGSTSAQTVSPGAHSVSEVASAGTNLGAYKVTIGGACSASGSITLAAGDNKVCTITSLNNHQACLDTCQASQNSCTASCAADRDACMASVPTPGGPRPQECVQAFNSCNLACTRQAQQCPARCP
jgi:hypothetical protein